MLSVDQPSPLPAGGNPFIEPAVCLPTYYKPCCRLARWSALCRVSWIPWLTLWRLRWPR